MRWPIITVGVPCSVVAAILTERMLSGSGSADYHEISGLVGVAGIVITLKIANAFVGGGGDTHV